jgi:hypothetical protein
LALRLITVGLSSSTETLRTLRRRLTVVTLGSSWTVRLRTDTPVRSRLSTPTRALPSVRVRDSTLAPPRVSVDERVAADAPERSEPPDWLDVVLEPPDEPDPLMPEPEPPEPEPALLVEVPEPEPPDEPELEPPELEVWA